MRRSELRIPTILGVLLSIIGLGAGVWFLREPLRSAVIASPEETPAQVRITNVSDNSFVVSWLTDKAAVGYIQYGEGANPNLVVSDDRDQESGSTNNYFTHLVTVRGVKPQTTYNFRIGSGTRLYDQQDQPYQVITGPILGAPPAADVAYGQITTSSGEPASGALVYLSLPGVIPQATIVKASGAWVIPLSTARTTDLTSYAAYDLETTTEQIQVVGGALGTSNVTTITGQDSPVADVSLGEDINLLATDLADSEATASADQTGTASASAASRFSTTALNPASESTAVLTITSPKLEEDVNSPKPVITGRGPANAQISITIESPVVYNGTVRANAQGAFSYTVPAGLTPGEHTITISTIVDGVVKKVSRSFTVMAAEESSVPAFSSTPSASLAPSPSPSPSPTPTLRPSPTPTLLPRVSLPSTQSGVPTSGNLTPTLVLLILGTGLMLSGLVVYRKLN